MGKKENEIHFEDEGMRYKLVKCYDELSDITDFFLYNITYGYTEVITLSSQSKIIKGLGDDVQWSLPEKGEPYLILDENLEEIKIEEQEDDWKLVLLHGKINAFSAIREMEELLFDNDTDSLGSEQLSESFEKSKLYEEIVSVSSYGSQPINRNRLIMYLAKKVDQHDRNYAIGVEQFGCILEEEWQIINTLLAEELNQTERKRASISIGGDDFKSSMDRKTHQILVEKKLEIQKLRGKVIEFMELHEVRRK